MPHSSAAPRPRHRGVLWWAALVVLVPVAIAALARATGWEAGPLAILISLMPWVALLSLVPLTLAVLARSWMLVGAAAVLVALTVAWQVPLFTGGGGGEPALTVAAANLRFGKADAEDVVALVKTEHVDVLALTELTPEAMAALEAAGLSGELAFHEARPEDDFSGTGLWSRYPLSDGGELDGFMSHQIRAVIDAPLGQVTVLAVHPRAPRNSKHDVWERELAELHSVLAAVDGPVIVAGDFNTTRDHKGFRDIEALGYVNAADQAGTGFAPTFSVGRGVFPFVVIDHVLERDTGMAALRTETVSIAEADHKALVVEYGPEP